MTNSSPLNEHFEIMNEGFDCDGAICAQIDPDLFFPELGGTTQQAKAACAVCPLVEECLRYALRADERYGVWGGKSVRERYDMRRSSREFDECDAADG